MTEPLPCPFCGEAPTAAERAAVTLTLPPRQHASVTCENTACWAQPYISDYLTLAEAIERWNKRAPVKCGPCAGCGFGDMGMSDEQRCELCS